jgi:hypothetical protein
MWALSEILDNAKETIFILVRRAADRFEPHTLIITIAL